MNHSLTIVEIAARPDGGHGLQSQSGRTECWLEGWIAVPEALADTVWACKGYCELEIEDGVLVGVVPGEEPVREPDPREQIDKWKEQLAATDYQIIKCGEYQLAGREVPYDIARLHAQRQVLRDQINALEASAGA